MYVACVRLMLAKQIFWAIDPVFMMYQMWSVDYYCYLNTFRTHSIHSVLSCLAINITTNDHISDSSMLRGYNTDSC